MRNEEKQTIRLWFTDSHTIHKDPRNNRIVSLLGQRYHVIIDPHDPEVVICSIFGNRWRYHSCRKIYYSGENSWPFNAFFSFSIGYGENSRTNIYWPLFLMYDEYYRDYQRLLAGRGVPLGIDDYKSREFCSFVVTNPKGLLRNLVFQILDSKKRVSSAGGFANNTGFRPQDKIEYMRSFRFNLCFENSSKKGYLTEKLVQAFAARVVPIYWGDPSVARVFNIEAFINVDDFGSFKKLVDYIMEVDSSPDLWLKYVNADPFNNGVIPKEYTDDWFLKEFHNRMELSKPRRSIAKWNPLFLFYMVIQNVWTRFLMFYTPKTIIQYLKNRRFANVRRSAK